MGKENKIKVIELFAGVGGFRLGLEGYKGKSSSSDYKKPLKSNFEVIWSNQYEPSSKKNQHASLVYQSRWPGDKKKNHSNKDIEDVIENDFNSIPNHDLLVGGFPCQDYSVATTLKNSHGLEGTKGVLWWSIYNILKKKGKDKAKYLILENVDRLLISPSNQRGRDFAVILSCLNELGYAVEWKVINPAEYGMPQRRRRVFIVAYHESTKIYKSFSYQNPKKIIVEKGVLANSFEVKEDKYIYNNGDVCDDKNNISKNFNKGKTKSPFLNSGFMIAGNYYSTKVFPFYNGEIFKLRTITERTPIKDVPKDFYITNEVLKSPKVKIQLDGKEKKITTEKELWDYLKGAKKELKTNKALGYQYKYAEGRMVFPDCLDKPSRTIITGEGGKSPSRFKHVIEPKKDVFRRLIPKELESLNMFPENHTLHHVVTDTKRAFLMGNALVVGVVERIGNTLNDLKDV